LASARRAEDLGYSTFAMPDHFMFPLAPIPALQAVADATTTLRVTQLVLAADFRHPAVLAKELATVDVLSGGRLEVGIGAGWKPDEFEQAGIPFDAAPIRIERLEEYAIVLKGLFAGGPVSFAGTHFTIAGLEGSPVPVQQPRPPIMIGGGGPRVLAVAARQADIVHVLPGVPRGEAKGRHPLTLAAFAEKVDLVRQAAGHRFADIELGTLLANVTITDDPEPVLDGILAGLGPSVPSDVAHHVLRREDLVSSPVVAVGPLEHVCDKLLAVRDTVGLTYFMSPVGVSPRVLAPVIERLAAIS
jgi:probable F420-dependent oxidoreductase